MACRIQNLGRHRLALDLRGGKILYLEPNEVSRPLREEWLYGNVHLPKWVEQGLVRRLDAKMAEVVAFEAEAAAAGKPPAAARDEARPKDDGEEAATQASEERHL